MDIPKIRVQSIAQAANFYIDKRSDNLTPVMGLLTSLEKRAIRREAVLNMSRFLVTGIPGHIPEGTMTMRF